MAVIEALMQLFIKEQVSVDRVLSTVKRFSAPVSTSEAPTDPDSALLLWTKRCCEALKGSIENELQANGDVSKFLNSDQPSGLCYFMLPRLHKRGRFYSEVQKSCRKRPL